MKLKTTVDRFLAQDEHMLSFGDSPQGSVAIREEGQTVRREEIAAYTGVARLMPEFEKVLRQDLWLTQNPKKRIATKKKLIRRYVADSDKLLQLAKELNDFVHDCIFSGIIFGIQRLPMEWMNTCGMQRNGSQVT